MGRAWPLAAALAIFFWRAAGREPEAAGRGRLLAAAYGLAGLSALGGLAVSFSRGAYLGAVGAAAALAVALLPRRVWASRRVLLPLGALAALGLLAAVAVVALDIERFNPVGASSGIRLQTWASALAMLRDHPLGVGLDQFGRLYPQYIDPALAGTNEINTAHPHNLLLDIALRMGPLGLVAFAWLISRLLRRCWPAPGKASSARRPTPNAQSAALRAGILAATAAALAHGLVDSFYFWPDLALAFWMFVALAEHESPEVGEA
jgi:O-antigen ligase